MGTVTRGIRQVVLALVAGAVLACAPGARLPVARTPAVVVAGTAVVQPSGYAQPRPATRAQQNVATRIARDYWRQNAPAVLARDGLPPCGVPRVSWARLPSGDADAAEAHLDGSCRIVFNSAQWIWPATTHQANATSGSDAWASFCTAMAHEWGHLILGPTYFQAANPADPAHSPDPRNLMYAFQVHELPACISTPDPAAGLAQTRPAQDRLGLSWSGSSADRELRAPGSR